MEASEMKTTYVTMISLKMIEKKAREVAQHLRDSNRYFSVGERLNYLGE